MKMRQVSEEVFYGDERIVRTSQEEIVFLKEQAMGNVRKRARLCAHQNVDALLHDMIIIHTNETYVPPHLHQIKSESFHIIEGEVNMITFEEDGSLSEVIQMGDYSSGKPFFYRTPEKTYHTLLITSEILVFHEATNGPFNQESTTIAPWAPDISNEHAAKEFMALLNQRIQGFF